MTPSPSFPDLTGLSADELRPMVVSLSGTVAKLEAQVIALTEEIARLKDLKGRPKLKPSGLEKGRLHGGLHPNPRNCAQPLYANELQPICGEPKALGCNVRQPERVHQPTSNACFMGCHVPFPKTTIFGKVIRWTPAGACPIGTEPA